MIKNLPAMQEAWVQSLGQKDPLEKGMAIYKNTRVFLPEEPHGQRSLVGYSPWDRKESDTTERLTLTLRLPTAGLSRLAVPGTVSELQIQA